MLSLFSTSSDKAGFRLQYMEVYNWGTFDGKIFRINPHGNNSLLTGANASGKSTFIDALLTLLVPVKKDRFYNQSSGVDKKGNRTEETYVYGHYGNIQEEGKLGTTTQSLRDKNTYSILLASFSNTDQRVVTVFQVRWFANGELKRAYGIAHVPLEIEKDFTPFDSKGNWKKRLEKNYNSTTSKKRIEFPNGPTIYAERMANLFGMLSTKALSLFNQIVGVKVLDDLDEFIRTHMLESLDAESEFILLKESFNTLMEAKLDIEKAKEQISQLAPINDLADILAKTDAEIAQLQTSRELAVYWFAENGIRLCHQELEKAKEQLSVLKANLKDLKTKEEQTKHEERTLLIAIESDSEGNQIKQLENEIKALEKYRDEKSRALENYNSLVRSVKLPENPDANQFQKTRDVVLRKKLECENSRNAEEEKSRLTKNEIDSVKKQIESLVETVQSLQNNNNNISGREAEIRDEILKHTGATKEEIPFIGELISINESETQWESSIEKILHNFALRLIVPDKYYKSVNEYVNKTNLRGKIIYQRYKKFSSLGNLRNNSYADNVLHNKLSFKTSSLYAEWIEDEIANQYNYACVRNLEEFNAYEEKAVTKEGLIKFPKGRHEKDDRPHISRRENFVLGWENKEKVNYLKAEVKKLYELEKQLSDKIREGEASIRTIEESKECYSDLQRIYTRFDDIHWQSCAKTIQEKEDLKKALESKNKKVKKLQDQLTSVQDRLSKIDKEIDQIKESTFVLDNQIKAIKNDSAEYKSTISGLGKINTTAFQQANQALLSIEYYNLKEKQTEFQKELLEKIAASEKIKRHKENEVTIKINAFKQPDEQITKRFKDWRADVSALPDSLHLEFIKEYQLFFKKLTEDNLPRFEKKFNEYLQETIIHKIGDFRTFFENWSDSIKENIRVLNSSLREIDFKDKELKTYIQLIASPKVSNEIKDFRTFLKEAIPNFKEIDSTIDGKKNHFENHIEPLISKLNDEVWRKSVMDVRFWYSYKAEEFMKETGSKFKTYENMGQLSGGEKAQLTYTILGSAIAYQFGLTKEGLQSNSFRFIAIDEAFKAQDEDKARYLINLCKQLHLQLLVVTPSDNIHIVEKDISYVHFVERKDERHSWLYDMPIEQFIKEKEKFVIV